MHNETFVLLTFHVYELRVAQSAEGIGNSFQLERDRNTHGNHEGVVGRRGVAPDHDLYHFDDVQHQKVLVVELFGDRIHVVERIVPEAAYSVFELCVHENVFDEKRRHAPRYGHRRPQCNENERYRYGLSPGGFKCVFFVVFGRQEINGRHFQTVPKQFRILRYEIKFDG